MTKFADVLAAVILGVLVLSGCTSDKDDGSDPTPTTHTTPTTPTPTTPAWQSDYTKEQLEAYDAAVDRFTTYEQRAEPIWSAGKTSPAAEQLFKGYFFDRGRSMTSKLELYERVGIRVVGTPKVLDSRPTRVKLLADGGSVTIRQCVDYTTVTGFQDGKQTTGAPKSPQVRILTLSRLLGETSTPWLIERIQEFKGERPCHA